MHTRDIKAVTGNQNIPQISQPCKRSLKMAKKKAYSPQID